MSEPAYIAISMVEFQRNQVSLPTKTVVVDEASTLNGGYGGYPLLLAQI